MHSVFLVLFALFFCFALCKRASGSNVWIDGNIQWTLLPVLCCNCTTSIHSI